MSRNKLSIVIPTYNRAKILKENILFIIKECKRLSIDIYISDDSTNLNTQKIINELRKKYSFIHYTKNTPRLGHDKNLFHTLQLSNSDYIWLLGDSTIINPNSLEKILDIINSKKSEIISLNTINRNIDFQTGQYSDFIEILWKFGWHLNLTGATIYPRDSIAILSTMDINKYKNFPQFSLIFSYLARKKSLYWINEKIISSNLSKESYWAKDVFKVFIDDWRNALSNISCDYKLITLKSIINNHIIRTKLFSSKSLLKLRMISGYNWESFIKYNKYIYLDRKFYDFIPLIVAIIPMKLILFFYNKLLKN